MDAKIIRTLKKLVSIMPAELKDGWRFHVYNVGGAGSRPYYGIISENNILPGINIELCQSSREPWWDKKRERMDEHKLTNVLAAYIAFAQPATVLELIEENERLREHIDRTQQHLAAALDVTPTYPDLLEPELIGDFVGMRLDGLRDTLNITKQHNDAWKRFGKEKVETIETLTARAEKAEADLLEIEAHTYEALARYPVFNSGNCVSNLLKIRKVFERRARENSVIIESESTNA